MDFFTWRPGATGEFASLFKEPVQFRPSFEECPLPVVVKSTGDPLLDLLVARRQTRMAQCADPNVGGCVQYNERHLAKPVPFSWEAMETKHGDKRWDTLKEKFGDKVPPQEILIRNLSGSPEVANQLLDFVADQASTSDLHSIRFFQWKNSVTHIEPEILSLFARKSNNLKKLWITCTDEIADQAKQALVSYVLEVIQARPYQLKQLNL